MPELPEVETVRKVLKTHVLKRKIENINVLYTKVFENIDVKLVDDYLKGQTINDIKRYGKWLIFCLDNYYMLSHLRMEGKYFYEVHDKHDIVVFNLDKGALVYNDVRKFGRMYLLNLDELYSDKSPLKKLGKEPFSKDLTLEYLKEKYKNSNKYIKTSLLDQTIIVGIGNIYADEILFKSKISPLRKCNTLTDLEIKNIIKYTKEILQKAIDKGGTTIKSYTSQEGVTGHFQTDLLVHQRQGKECSICKSEIIKIKVNGRGTYYCPKCQK